MPASIYAWLPEEREDEERKQLLEGLYRELDECTEVKITFFCNPFITSCR